MKKIIAISAVLLALLIGIAACATTTEPETDDFVVRFNTDGGTSINGQVVPAEGRVTAPTPPSKPGYTFGGWFTDKACTKPFDFNTEITASTTLNAKWISNTQGVTFTVTFNTNGEGAVGGPAAQTVNEGEKAVAPTVVPSREGFVFGGWFADAAGDVAFSFDTAITANRTLYAKWTPVATCATCTPGPAAICGVPQTCTVCNAVIDALPATAHVFNTPLPNCTMARFCLNARCGFVSAPINPDAHAPGNAATCGTAQNCTRCEKVVVAPLGNCSYSQVTCVAPAICTVPECRKVQPGSVPLAHNHQTAACGATSCNRGCNVVTDRCKNTTGCTTCGRFLTGGFIGLANIFSGDMGSVRVDATLRGHLQALSYWNVRQAASNANLFPAAGGAASGYRPFVVVNGIACAAWELHTWGDNHGIFFMESRTGEGRFPAQAETRTAVRATLTVGGTAQVRFEIRDTSGKVLFYTETQTITVIS